MPKWFLIDETFQPDPLWNPVEDIQQIAFVKGRDLSRSYYMECVLPIIDKFFPGLKYSAAHIGQGSDILGFDTPGSRDHAWGPTVTLFLPEEDRNWNWKYCSEEYAKHRHKALSHHDNDPSGIAFFLQNQPHHLSDDIDFVLRKNLPDTHRGYPTSVLGSSPFTGTMWRRKAGGVNHFITFQTINAFFKQMLNWDTTMPIKVADWLSFPEHLLAFLSCSEVFHDGIGFLKSALDKLSYYPDDVWFYLMASQWARIGSEETYLGRCGHRGDELGERFISSRLAYYAMRLCFLIERKYAPYSKWFTAAFDKLPCANIISPHIKSLLSAGSHSEREKHYCGLATELGRLHNRLEITKPLDTAVIDWHKTRPCKIIDGHRYRKCLLDQISERSQFRFYGSSGFGLIGSIEQIVDAHSITAYPARVSKIAEIYRTEV